MKPRDIFLFCVTCFLALTVTNAGIFLNDEWMSAAQLTQIGQGHQFTYNEGSFGYFENGTTGTYMETRNNVLMYSIALPLVALPMFLITSLFATPTILPILVWIVFGTLAVLTAPVLTQRQRVGIGGLIWIAGVTSILICPPDVGDARAVIAIVVTNILLYGGFAILVRRIVDLLIEPGLQWYAWIVTMASSTLLFWAGTCKDHMLVAVIVLSCCYCMLQYSRTSGYLMPAALCAGLMLWVRTEVGVFVLVAFVVLLLLYQTSWKQTVIGTGVAVCSTLPFFVNNWLVSGNVLTPPFLMANAAKYTDDVVDHTATFGLNVLSNIPYYFNPLDGLQIVMMPASGAVGLTVFGIAIIAFIALLRRPDTIDRDMLTMVGFGIASFTYYIVFCGFQMHTDTGIMPDIRYASAAYAPLTLAALVLLTRLYTFDGRAGMRTILIGTLVIVPATLIILLLVPVFGASYPQFNHLINLALMGMVGITVVGMRRNPQLGVSLIAITLIVWQLVMCFVYGDIKVNGYPYLPVVDWLHNLMFVW